MCTLSIHTRVYERYPLIIAANRDEYADREWREPGYHWPDAPGVFGPLDVASGGSWLGVNRHGLVCAVLNQGRTQSLGMTMRSRGELVVTALRHASLAQAAAWLSRVEAGRYLGFHLLLADQRHARLFSTSLGQVVEKGIEPGVHILSSKGLDGADCPKAARFLGPMRHGLPAAPEARRWQHFRELLATTAYAQPKDGFWIDLGNGYGTRSSAIVALDAHERSLELLHSRRAEAPLERAEPMTRGFEGRMPGGMHEYRDLLVPAQEAM